MQRDPRFHPRKEVPHFGDQWGNDYPNNPVASSFAAALPPAAKNLMPLHGIEFQSSEVCPKNFIIFDQTDHRSQIMFHPAVAHKFGGPGLNMHSSYIPENFDMKGANDCARETSSFAEEDSDDINALLSMEEEEEDEYDEEVSTARTYGCYGNNSPDSCSTRNYKLRKNASSSSQKNSNSSSGDSSSGERKRHKMKKMVKALRKIVPGGDQMNTANVLDEAVKYLKSLKVEVQKLDVGDFKN